MRNHLTISSNLILIKILNLEIKWQLIAALCIALAGSIVVFPFSFFAKSNVLIGLALFPFVLFCSKERKINYIYFVMMILFACIGYVYSVRMFYFFTVAFFILFAIEYCIGKTTILILFLLIFMSPFFEQVVGIMGFPIRLQLSALAGNMLTAGGFNIQVDGNMMLLEGSSFTVDEACMGLNMLASSFLMGVFAIGHQYRVKNKRLPFMYLSTFFIVVFLLNILANLFRIMLLVAFKILPYNPMHEVTGILCLCLYVIIPLYGISRWMVYKFGKAVQQQIERTNIPSINNALLLIPAVCILFLGFHIEDSRSKAVMKNVSVTISGFHSVQMKNGVTKLYKDDALVYIKPIPEFFTGEHTPLFCWRGSGYTFKGISKKIINDHEVYYGQLQKPGKHLFTAWWYSNGKVQTINQLDWRFRMLKGEDKFSLLNVTAENEKKVFEYVADILGQKI